MRRQRGLGLAQRRLGFVAGRRRAGGIESMDATDGAAAGANDATARGQADLPRRTELAELAVDAFCVDGRLRGAS
jgi:hypothetical protein